MREEAAMAGCRAPTTRAVRCAGRRPGPPPGGDPLRPPPPFPLAPRFRNGPRRQGSAPPRKTRAPLTAPVRSEHLPQIRERGQLQRRSEFPSPEGDTFIEEIRGTFLSRLDRRSRCGLTPRSLRRYSSQGTCRFNPGPHRLARPRTSPFHGVFTFVAIGCNKSVLRPTIDSTQMISSIDLNNRSLLPSAAT